MPRESSPTDPQQWRITEDGKPFDTGDRLFNYYGRKWGTVGEIDSHDGWFTFTHDDGTQTSLNCSRVASHDENGNVAPSTDREPTLPTWRYDPERKGEFPYCPVCDGRTEITLGVHLICQSHGSEHYHAPDYHSVYDAHFGETS